MLRGTPETIFWTPWFPRYVHNKTTKPINAKQPKLVCYSCNTNHTAEHPINAANTNHDTLHLMPVVLALQVFWHNLQHTLQQYATYSKYTVSPPHKKKGGGALSQCCTQKDWENEVISFWMCRCEWQPQCPTLTNVKHVTTLCEKLHQTPPIKR